MKITSKAGNGNKIHIYIDGEYTLTLYDDFWYKAGFKENQEISEEELASLKEEAGFRSAYEKGIQYLSMRAYSQKELYTKLKIKYGDVSATRAIDKLLYRKYIDDESFANSYAHHLFEVKKFDLRRISYELKQKGISSEIIDNTLKSLDNEPITRIIDMIESKYINYIGNDKDIKRLVNRFIRMGYSFHDIQAALREFDTTIQR
jgi:regulatory protein